MTNKLPNNLQKFRLEKQLSQSKLAKNVGITIRYVNKLEHGSQTPSFKLSKKIADLLGKTVDEIFFTNTAN